MTAADEIPIPATLSASVDTSLNELTSHRAAATLAWTTTFNA